MYEINVNNEIPLLEGLIEVNNDNFKISVNKKLTSINSCILDNKSECPR